MRHGKTVDTDRYGLDTKKGKMIMQQALLALKDRLGSKRLAAQRVDASVMWTEEDKKKGGK